MRPRTPRTGPPAVVETPPAGPTPAAGNPANGNPTNGNPATGNPANGNPAAGNPINGNAANGNAANGNAANGNAANGNHRNYGNGGSAPYRNGSPLPPVNGAVESYGAPVGDPFINGGADPSGDSAAPDTPYANGAGGRYGNGGPVRGGDGPGAPYANGNTTYGAPRPGGPSVNGSADTTYSGPPTRAGELPVAPSAGPYGNGNGNGGPRGTPESRTPARNPRRGGLSDDLATAPENDTPFVNGGAYVESETTRSAPWTPNRPALREPLPRDIDGPTDGRAEPWSPPAAERARARPTEELPRLRSDRTPMLDPG